MEEGGEGRELVAFDKKGKKSQQIEHQVFQYFLKWNS